MLRWAWERCWYWWQCRACRWNGVRWRNARVCPRCGARRLLKFRRAKPREIPASYARKVVPRFALIPRAVRATALAARPNLRQNVRKGDPMDVATITMPREEAIRAYREFRQDIKDFHGEEPSAQDQAILLGYQSLAKGHSIIDLTAAIGQAGLDAEARPKLAVARASWARVEFRSPPWENGCCFGRQPRPRRGRWPRLGFPRATFPTGPLCYSCTAQVPYLPPSIRPGDTYEQLNRYCVLWEAVWTQEPPTDPMLLRHLTGTLYAVLAVWDLSPLERAVMGQRLIP
jgi:hypothetical protein